MDDERMDRLEKMMAQLIQMVGNNNAVTEELRQKVTTLDTKVDTVSVRVDALDTKIDTLSAQVDALDTKVDTGFQQLTSMINLLSEKVDNIEKTLLHHDDVLNILAARTTHQEADINRLKMAE